MRKDDITTALELMQGGLEFSHNADGWWWEFGDMSRSCFICEYDAVSDFCQWYAQTSVVKDEPQPVPFDLDAFMMDGIQALVRAAAEEMRARGEGFDAETVAGALARAWHDVAPECGWPW